MIIGVEYKFLLKCCKIPIEGNWFGLGFENSKFFKSEILSFIPKSEIKI